MKKLTLTSILAISLICPAYADNENITNENKGCTSGTLTVDSGTAALEADWQPNTVNVTYYSGGSVYGNAGQCTYDGTLTLPANPSQPGYTFAGWRVRASAAPSQQTLDCSIYEWDECETHDGCIRNDFGESECANRVETQYTSCTQGKTEIECNAITDAAGEEPCVWDSYYGCILVDWGVSHESWCTGRANTEEDGILRVYWTGQYCDLEW